MLLRLGSGLHGRRMHYPAGITRALSSAFHVFVYCETWGKEIDHLRYRGSRKNQKHR